MKNTENERIYVKVTSEFDQTGNMLPTTITWLDGRVFKIDKVIDFVPLTDNSHGKRCDGFQIEIRGNKRELFFERDVSQFSSRFGRWFVNCPES